MNRGQCIKCRCRLIVSHGELVCPWCRGRPITVSSADTVVSPDSSGERTVVNDAVAKYLAGVK